MKLMHLPKFIVIALLLITAASCQRERGCTDRTAYNYNPSAQVDNGTCRYYGYASFWISTNYPDLTVNINGQSAAVTVLYTTGSPSDCSEAGNANFVLPEGTYSYNAASGTTTWSGTTTIYAGECNLLHLN